MREWLSGGVSPCQGEGRGFESRLALFYWLEFPESKGIPAFLLAKEGKRQITECIEKLPTF